MNKHLKKLKPFCLPNFLKTTVRDLSRCIMTETMLTLVFQIVQI